MKRSAARISIALAPALALALALALVLAAARPVIAKSGGKWKDTRVACLDLSRAMADTKDGKTAQAMLQKDFDAKQKDLDLKSADLKAKVAGLETIKQSSPNEYAALKDKYERELVALTEQFTAYQEQLDKKEQGLSAKIASKLQGVVGSIAKDRGIDMVLAKDGVFWTDASFDVTPQVIEEYDKLPPLF